MCLHPVHDVLRTHCSRLSRNFTAIPEQNQRGNAAYTILRTKILLSFCINLDQAYRRFQLLCRTQKMRCHHLAGSAPRRPKIHQHGNIIARNMSCKTGLCQLQRMGGKQCLMTLTAIRLLIKARGRYPVNAVTVRANYMQRIIHRKFLQYEFTRDDIGVYYIQIRRNRFIATKIIERAAFKQRREFSYLTRHTIYERT